jgi:hypothetical protein
MGVALITAGPTDSTDISAPYIWVCTYIYGDWCFDFFFKKRKRNQIIRAKEKSKEKTTT